MNIKYLQSFVKIVECGNFFRAAEELFLTQSALSKQIQNIEKELHVTLFDRTKRSAQLTNAGQKLYQRLPEFLLSYQQIVTDVAATGYSLDVTVLPILEHYGLARYLVSFSEKFPQVELTIREAQNAVIPEQITKKANSLGIFRIATPEEEANWIFLPLCTDELALVVPRSYALPEQAAVSLADFASEKFILLSEETQLYAHSVNACLQAGFSPKIIYQGASAETINYMVAQGKGVALLMRQVALNQSHTQNLVLRFRETLQSRLILAHSKLHTLNEAGKLFWNFMRENV